MQESLSGFISDIRGYIEKMETVGKKLRSVIQRQAAAQTVTPQPIQRNSVHYLQKYFSILAILFLNHLPCRAK